MPLLLAGCLSPGLGVAQLCGGDCSGDGTVAINELVTCVNVALGAARTCAACDGDGNGLVAINDLIGAVNHALDGCPVATPTATPVPATATPVAATATLTPRPSVVPTSRGALSGVANGAQAAMRMGLAAQRWLAAVSGIEPLVDQDATSCATGSATLSPCVVTGASAARQIDYDACVTSTASGHQVVRSGRIRVVVQRADYCRDSQILPGDAVTLFLDGFAQRETAGAEPLLSLAATLTSARQGRGRSGCAGIDTGEELSGTLQLSCVPQAESWPCPEAGVDVMLSADALTIERRSGGFPCEREATLSGRLSVQDRASGETYAQSFESLRISERTQGDGVRSLDLAGRLSSDCLGAVDLLTLQPLQLPPRGDCPVAGALNLGQARDESAATTGSLAALVGFPPADVAAGEPGGAATEEGELRQRLFRAANGQLYQVVQNTRAGTSLGAEVVRITTVVGALGAVSECATAADARAEPQAVVAATRALPLDAAVKSELIASASEPCFNRNADDGAGRVCLGKGCTADCQCPQGGACASFSQSSGTPIAQANTIPAAVIVSSLISPSPPCNGFGGLTTYRFGGTGPTTETAQCAVAPADGFNLAAGQTIVFAYDVPPLAPVQAGVGGLLVDTDGADAVGCGAGGNQVLNAGETEKQSIAGPQVTFTDSGAMFDYDPTGGVGGSVDATLGCAAAVRLTCDDMVTPTPTSTPTPGAARPCGAVGLPSADAIVQPGTTAGSLDHTGGADCGWTKGGTGWPDTVFEYVPPADGTYDIAVTGVGFDPLLYVRADSCLSPAQLACNDNDAEAGGAGAAVAVYLVRGQRIAVIVDGEDARGGQFSLQLRRRRPDLSVQRLIGPAAVDAGADVVVSAELRNDGDAAAGPFRAEFFFARSADLGERLGRTPVVCTVAGLAPGETTLCAPTAALQVPLVAAGDYVLAVRVDPDGAVDESREDNNVALQLARIGIVGAELEQQLLRGSDGTAYQLLRVVPSTTRSAAEHFQITGVAGSSAMLRSCASTVSTPGGAAVAAVQGVDDLGKIRRTAILLPNDLAAISFDPAGSGRLGLGTGPLAIGVCKRPADCAGLVPAQIASLANADDRIPGACLAELPEPGILLPCEGEEFVQTLAFGLSATGDPPTCTDPESATIESEVCALSPIDGFTLRPGEAMVLVYEPGFTPFSTAVAAYGIDEDESNPPGCAKGELVEALALRADSAQPPILTFVERYKKDRLNFASVAFSNDGRHLYAASDKSLFIFGRATDGAPFELVDIVQDGIDGVTGLHLPNAVVVSPDDRSVYVVGGDSFEGEDSLIVFQRDIDAGRLSLVQILRRGIGLRDTLFDRGIAVSPDGSIVYLTLSDGLEVLRRNPDSLRLQLIESEVTSPLGEFSERAAVSPDGRHVYLAGECIAVFDYDALTGIVTGRDSPASCVRALSIALSPDGAHLYALGENALSILSRDDQSGALTSVDALELPSGARAGSPSIAISGNGERVAVLLADSTLRVYRRTSATGLLEPLDVAPDAVLDAPVSVALSADGRTVAVGNGERFNNGSYSVAVYDEVDGTLRLRETLPRAGLPFEGLGGASALASDPLGANVYVTGASDDAVVAFARDVSSGQLTQLEVHHDEDDGIDGLAGAAAVAVSPDGRHVYVVGTDDRAIALFDRSDTGTLRYSAVYRAGANGIDRPPGLPILVGRDGANVYVHAQDSDEVLVFRRRASDGTLTLEQTLRTTADGTTGVSPDAAMALSPDQRHMYVAGRSDDFSCGIRIAILQRDAQTGHLSPLNAIDADLGLINDCVGNADIFVNPDGLHVYLSTSRDRIEGAIVSLSRNPTTGALSDDEDFSWFITSGARDGTITPGGSYLFFTSIHDGSNGGAVVALFADRLFDFEEVQRNGLGRVDGLTGPSALMVSPDGRHLYVTGSGDNAIAVFRLNQPDPATTQPALQR